MIRKTATGGLGIVAVLAEDFLRLLDRGHLPRESLQLMAPNPIEHHSHRITLEGGPVAAAN